MGKLHLFKYSFSHLFFDRLAGRKTSHLLIQKDNSVRRHLHLMGLSVQCVGGVEQRMKPLPTFFVSVKLWLHSHMRIWAPSSWSQRELRV